MCKHCSSNPVKAVAFWEYLRRRDHKLTNPISSNTHPGHYLTFLESSKLLGEDIKTGNDGLPSAADVQKQNCPMCPSYAFNSETERKRQMSIFHHEYKESRPKKISKKYRCTYCKETFPSNNKLKKHTKLHKNKKKIIVVFIQICFAKIWLKIWSKGVMPTFKEYVAAAVAGKDSKPTSSKKYAFSSSSSDESDNNVVEENNKVNETLKRRTNGDKHSSMKRKKMLVLIVQILLHVHHQLRKVHATKMGTSCISYDQGDYVKIMKGTFKEFFGVVLGDSYGDEIEINYFKEMYGKPYGRYWVLEPNDQGSRTNDEVQKVEPNLIDRRGRFVF